MNGVSAGDVPVSLVRSAALFPNLEAQEADDLLEDMSQPPHCKMDRMVGIQANAASPASSAPRQV